MFTKTRVVYWSRNGLGRPRPRIN